MNTPPHCVLTPQTKPPTTAKSPGRRHSSGRCICACCCCCSTNQWFRGRCVAASMVRVTTSVGHPLRWIYCMCSCREVALLSVQHGNQSGNFVSTYHKLRKAWRHLKLIRLLFS